MHAASNMCSCPCSKALWKEKQPCSRTPVASTCLKKPCSDRHERTHTRTVHHARETLWNVHVPDHTPTDSSTHSKSPDIESGSTTLEHMIIQFHGSNCPGCSSKISKALESLPCVQNLHINVAVLQAEFDIDLNETCPKDVLIDVQRTTGLECERIKHGSHVLDIVLSNPDTDLDDTLLLPGVTDISKTSKCTFRITYDAKAVGARQLLHFLNEKWHDNDENAILLADPPQPHALSSSMFKAIATAVIAWLLTIPLLILTWAPLPPHPLPYSHISFALATLIQVFILGPYYPRAFRDLFLAHMIGMDLLIVLSTSVAYGVSVASFACEVSGKDLGTEVGFETGALLITLIVTGRLISDIACRKAIRAQTAGARELQPGFVVIMDAAASADEGAEEGEREIDVRLLQYGDYFKVKSGEVVVTDGVVVSGISEVDESIVTGEAKPVEKGVGASVIAGSRNQKGGNALLVQLSRLPGENTIDEITSMVEDVTRSKPRAQEIADQVAKWIAPAIGTLALLTLAIWFTIGIVLRKQSAGATTLAALPYAVAVLVVSCPCAIGLAVPMVLIVASGVGAKYGVVFKSAEVLRKLRGVTHVIFDKTGTLTESELSVVREEYCSGDRGVIGGLILALTSGSNHPVSSAVAKHLTREGFQSVQITDTVSVIGKGIKTTYRGKDLRIGNARWLSITHEPIIHSLLSRSLTVLCATLDNQLIAVYGLTSTLRPSAKPVIQSLMDRGICVAILSGDETNAVQKVAKDLGISPKNVKAQCTPLEKQQHVQRAMADSRKTVLFVGDGVNDAAALAQADIGLHIQSDASTNTNNFGNAGHASLLRPSLTGILVLMDLGRDAWRLVVFNFAWAAVYNLVAILFAAGAFVRVRLRPEFAGLGEVVSVLPVVLVPMGLWLRRYR